MSLLNVSTVTHFLLFLNILSLFLYGKEYKETGQVVTSSGSTARGYHEIPAVLALLAYLYLTNVAPSKNKGLHPLIGGRNIRQV